MKKGLGITLSALVPFLGAFAVFFAVSFRMSRPGEGGDLAFREIGRDVRVVRDRWGIPHIYAQDEDDLFFGVGYVQAEDRMWEMDLARRLGFGRLSEIVGGRALDWDKAVRSLGLPEAVRRNRGMLSADMRRVLERYASGVNAWMRSRRAYAWPPGFMVLAYRPEPWRIEDSLVVKPIASLGLDADAFDEIFRTRIVNAVGPAAALTILSEGTPAPADPELLEEASPRLSRLFDTAMSNSWVVAGSRTASGRPLLANDPHLAIELPPLWYEMHLECPTLRVTGVTFPGLPLVVIGHNGRVAWGITDSFADTEDLYLEQLDPSGRSFRTGESWKPLDTRRETIAVRWRGKPETIDVSWTDRGPIISPAVVQSRLPLSLRWTAHEPGRAFEGFYGLNKAEGWADFLAALALIDGPPQNFVYADTRGNIGYRLSGRIPVRKREAALYPYPGWRPDGRWTGFLAEAEKPSLFNPGRGHIVTANNRITPPGYPHYISESWLLPFRAERIEELLLEGGKHSVESMMRIQNDILSKQAELVLPYVRGPAVEEGGAPETLSLLEGWDGTVGPGTAPAVFEVFMDRFYRNTFDDELGDIFEGLGILLEQEPVLLYRILPDGHSIWFDDTATPEVEDREAIVRKSLEEAVEWLGRKYGRREKWDWARLHALRLRNPLGRIPLLGFFNAGTWPMPGDAFTVRAAYARRGFGTRAAASYRMIVDLGDVRSSLAVITSGESGHFLSRHYTDQLPLWLRSEYHLMLFDREDIEDNAESVFVLRAAGKVGGQSQ